MIHLLPVFLQGWQSWEVAGVVDKLEFLEYTITSQDIHAAAEQDPFFLLLCVFVCSGGGLVLIIKKKRRKINQW